MAEPASRAQQQYPLPVYNFRVSIDGTTLGFAEVSGIEMRMKAVTYRHGLSFAEGQWITTFAAKGFVPITLRRGLILGSSPLFLYQWLHKGDLRAMKVDLCDASGSPALEWKIKHAVPTRLEAPAFDASSNEAAIEVLEVQAQGISVS